MPEIEIEANGFAGEFAIVKSGNQVKKFNYVGSQTGVTVESDTSYVLWLRGGITSSMLRFNIDGSGKITTGSVSPAGAADIVKDGECLELSTQDLTVDRGEYRGSLTTNLGKWGDEVDFSSSQSLDFKVISNLLFIFDTTVVIGCSSFSGVVKDDGSIEMVWAPLAVSTSTNKIELQTVEVELTPKSGQHLTISGQRGECSAQTSFELIRSVCVRIGVHDTTTDTELTFFDFSPTDKLSATFGTSLRPASSKGRV